jgi:hypothetical protein
MSETRDFADGERGGAVDPPQPARVRRTARPATGSDTLKILLSILNLAFD